MIKACVFDLDGTLLDTLPAIRYFVNVFMEKYGLLSIDLQKTAAFVGDGAVKLIERAIENSGVEINSPRGRELFSDIHPEYVREYNDDPFFMTDAYDGIKSALASLKASGIKLAVLSNKPHDTVVQLARKYFPDTFSEVAGAKDAVPLKPAPDGALDICRRLGVQPSEVAYFGDTGVDMKTAAAFGAGAAVGVLWGFRGRDELIADGATVLLAHPSEIYGLICGGKYE
jgi:phosphoglycolate phosphatase